MARNRAECEKVLPEGTIYWHNKQTYQYKAFCMDMGFLALHTRFNWQRHIDHSVEKCLKSTYDRFLRVQ